MMRSVVLPVFFLVGALTFMPAGEPGIIQRRDEFEFVYRVKLPEITALLDLDTARQGQMLFKRKCEELNSR